MLFRSVVEYIVNDNLPSHTEKSAKVKSTLMGVIDGEIPENTIKNVEYRTDTDVYLSCDVTALSDINTDNPASVKFTVKEQNGATQEIIFTDLLMPAGATQRAYVPYHVKDIEGEIVVDIATTGSVFSHTSKITGKVEKIKENTPPNPVYVDKSPHFMYVNPPVYPNVTQHVWYTYTAENTGGKWQYTEHENKASLNCMLQIQPDERVPLTDGSDIKSGYGINENLTTIYKSTGDIIAPQTVVSFYPEFNYKTYWNILEPIVQSTTQSVFSLPVNTFSFVDARVHFLPLWYPDGGYKTYTTVRDTWTPVGELKQSVTDVIDISGTVYDDWYIAKATG